MLLQTLIQLHILLAATPGLAGWTLFLPASQTLTPHTVYMVARHPIPTEGFKQTILQGASPGSVTQVPALCPTSAASVTQTSLLRSPLLSPLPYGLSSDASFSTHSPRAP